MNALVEMSGQFGNISELNTQNTPSAGLRNTIFYKMVSVPFFYKMLKTCLYQSDFGAAQVIGFGKDSDITQLFNTFLNSIGKEMKHRNEININKKAISNLSHLVRQVLEIKGELTSRLITYENMFEHFPNLDHSTSTIVKRLTNDQINTSQEFQKELDSVIHTIQIYNELMTLDGVFIQIDALKNMASSDNSSILNVAKLYKDTVLNAYESLSSLTTVVSEESLSDYLVFNNALSVTRAIDDITKFLSTSYNKYITGYTIFDKAIDGIESSSVHIIAGPSNHAKSIFMLNVAKGLIVNNRDKIKEHDAIVFITLEDDIHKLLRRIISIFGCYDTRIVKSMFQHLSTFFQKHNNIDITNKKARAAGLAILNDVLMKSIVTVTGGKCSFIIKHCNENSFSMRDGSRFIDKLKLEGIETKALFIDYLDVMKSSSSKYASYNDDYNLHGEILQEMRTAAKNYAIPIITITQNARISENVQQELSNNVIGDSYKKVRYADYISMIRQRPDIDLISDTIKNDMDGDSSVLNMSSDLSKLIPFEVKITKAKDGERGAKRFHLFSRQDLNIYQSYDDLTKNGIETVKKTAELQKSLAMLNSNINMSIIDMDDNNNHQTDILDNILL